MDAYTFALALGGIGLLVMAVSGLGHRLHPGGPVGHVGARGHGRLHGSAPRAGGAGRAGVVRGGGGRAGHTHGVHAGIARVSRAFLTILSPRVGFSLLVGFGATGFLLKSAFSRPIVIALAAAGAVFFEGVVVRPLFNFVSRFASEPALTLESSLGDEVRAVSTFDGRGQGLVALEVDGQIVQLLGTLVPRDLAGPRVRAGDALYVTDVDSERHRVTVSRDRD